MFKSLYFMALLENNYRGYGYEPNEAFVTIAKQKGLKYSPVKNFEEQPTQIESFVSNAGQPTGDLVQPEVFQTFK